MKGINTLEGIVHFRSRKRRDERSSQIGFLATLEVIFYEIKPILYLAFTLAVLNGPWTSSLIIKYSTVGIGLFAIYIIYCRLVHRGHI